MPHIVESSLDIGGKIIPWNSPEMQNLMKEKEEYLNKKPEEIKVKEVKEEVKEEIKNEKNKRNEKAGEK